MGNPKRPTPRPYQQRAIAGVLAQLDNRPLLVSPTGSGKTVMGCEIIDAIVAGGGRVLVLAHRRELIDQTARKLHAYKRAGSSVLVESIQRAAGRNAMLTLPMMGFRAIVIDEAHHACAATYKRVIDAMPSAAVIGLTATPFRLDGKGLGEVFRSIVSAATPMELIDAGSLLAPRYFVGRKTPDMAGVRKARGDYAQGAAAEKVDTPEIVGDVIEQWQRLAADRVTVCYAASIEHSRHLVDRWQAIGVAAAHLDGKTPADERSDIIAGLAERRIQVVSNYAILTEGWDLPSCGACVLARPTASTQLYLQMVGRVMRPDPADPDGPQPLVLDHAGNVVRHGRAEQTRAATLAGIVKQEVEALRTCKQCFAVYPPQPICPSCGHQHQAEARQKIEAEIVEGELVELAKEAAELWPHQGREFAQLLVVASKRAYRVGWARAQMRLDDPCWRADLRIEREFYRPWGKPITRKSLQSFADKLRAAGALPDEEPDWAVSGRRSTYWKPQADRAAWLASCAVEAGLIPNVRPVQRPKPAPAKPVATPKRAAKRMTKQDVNKVISDLLSGGRP